MFFLFGVTSTIDEPQKEHELSENNSQQPDYSQENDGKDAWRARLLTVYYDKLVHSKDNIFDITLNLAIESRIPKTTLTNIYNQLRECKIDLLNKVRATDVNQAAEIVQMMDKLTKINARMLETRECLACMSVYKEVIASTRAEVDKAKNPQSACVNVIYGLQPAWKSRLKELAPETYSKQKHRMNKCISNIMQELGPVEIENNPQSESDLAEIVFWIGYGIVLCFAFGAGWSVFAQNKAL